MRFRPDDVRPYADLAKRVADLERQVRAASKHQHHLRDLKDGNMFDAEDGQVPVYDAATGTYRPGTAGSAAATPIAWFNNSDGSMDASRYQQFNQLATLGDTSWFTFPQGGDTTLIQINQPGIITVTFKATGAGGWFDADVYAGDDAVIAYGYSGSAVSCSGSALFQLYEVDPDPSAAVIKVHTPGTATPVYGSLSLTFHAGTPTFSTH